MEVIVQHTADRQASALLSNMLTALAEMLLTHATTLLLTLQDHQLATNLFALMLMYYKTTSHGHDCGEVEAFA